MLFNFRLRALGEIAPWHDGKGENPHLGWYGLTDGWYWITAGDAELFRYSQSLVDTWKSKYRGAPWLAALPYVDYQVARLRNDVLDILPEILEPLPAPLAHLLTDYERWAVWVWRAAEAVDALSSDDEAWTLLDDATGWWWKRRLDTLYLQAGPDIWFWSDDADVHIQWDNRERLLDGHQAWEALLGHFTLTREAFLEEVRAFDASLIRRMHDRVAISQGEWSRPEIALDSFLNQAQAAESRYLQRRFEQIAQHEPTAWDAVFRAIARIEALPSFAADAALRPPLL